VRRLIFTTAAATHLGGAALADNISVTGPVPTPEGFVVTVHNPPKARPGLIAADGTPTPLLEDRDLEARVLDAGGGMVLMLVKVSDRDAVLLSKNGDVGYRVLNMPIDIDGRIASGALDTAAGKAVVAVSDSSASLPNANRDARFLGQRWRSDHPTRNISSRLHDGLNPWLVEIDLASGQGRLLTRGSQASALPGGAGWVFARYDQRTAQYDLYRWNRGDGSVVAVTQTPRRWEVSPAVSPDGSTVAYTVMANPEKGRVETMPLAGGNETVVTDGPLDEAPRWIDDHNLVVQRFLGNGWGIKTVPIPAP